MVADGSYNLKYVLYLHRMDEYEEQAQLAGGFTCPPGQIAPNTVSGTSGTPQS